jgi:two-component system, NtrC family, response regulator PilR
MPQPLALVIDDEPDICELIDITLKRMNINSLSASNLSQAKTLLSQHMFNLCLTDLRLPDGNGIEMVKHIHRAFPDLPVAVITAHGNMELAIEALKSGAFDFVSKPVDLQLLRKLVDASLKASFFTRQENQEKILGESAPIKKIRNMITKLARSQAPVFISGESGTGKELAARAIHENSPRGKSNFVAVNCGAIPLELMESEFFGHKKGSFTGATSDKQGLFQSADGGTLFLDEIADLPLSVQVKLLRAIQEKSIRPIGATEEIKIDTRIISATHKDLQKLVRDETFRQDLYFRINVIELPIPSLQERTEDILILCQHFVKKIAENFGCKTPKISDAAIKKLQQYDYPGNIRELENVLERSITLNDGSDINEHDILLTNHQLFQNTPIESELIEIDVSTQEQASMEDKLFEIEKKMIISALEETRWNKTAAAKKLGITFRVLRYRLEKLGLDKDG